MGTGDLNLLKSWNPKLMKNRKKVWEREQEIIKEEEKYLQRQKEIKKEKELNELLNSSRDPDVKSTAKLQNGLEWMYNDKDNLPEEKEDYLLGRKKLDTSVIKVQKDDLGTSSKDPFISRKRNNGLSGITNQEKKTYNYDNDDPMAKLMARRKPAKKIIKKVTKNNGTKPRVIRHTSKKSKSSSEIDY